MLMNVACKLNWVLDKKMQTRHSSINHKNIKKIKRIILYTIHKQACKTS